MPSSPTFIRKITRNGQFLGQENGRRPRRSPCSSRRWIRFLYAVTAILLIAIFQLWQKQQFTTPVAPQIGCGEEKPVEDTLRFLRILPEQTKVIQLNAGEETLSTDKLRNEFIDLQIQTGDSRPKVLAFVGIQTGFGSSSRRQALRKTWLPSTPEGILKLEQETGLAFRFVIGYTSDRKATEELEKEIETHRDFLRIDHEETYNNLPFKTLTFFKAAYSLFDAEFYVKADDDIYLRPDRFAQLIKKRRSTSRTYLGCMKKGYVITDKKYKWFEPLGYLLGSEYFLHAYGPLYALSRDVVGDMTKLRNDSMRMFSNEDVTIGSWMLAFNVNHENNLALCHTECRKDSVSIWDIPKCSGLCNPEKRLIELHGDDFCSKSPTLPSKREVKRVII